MASPSTTRQMLLAKVQKLVPPMLECFHKGQHGRVAVIGGGEEYTGAPYFAAMAAAKLGCDMSHVISTPSASAVIRTYSPNLMVHHYLPLPSAHTSAAVFAAASNSCAARITALFPRLHALVIGPGLSPSAPGIAAIRFVITSARSAGLAIVLDADALRMVCDSPSLVRGYELCVMTPNAAELARLAKAVGVSADDADDPDAETVCARLARAWGGVTIVHKGARDVVSNGELTLVSDGEGAPKRSGGQGDTLAGCVGTMLAWRRAYHEGMWERGGEEMDRAETVVLAAFGASAVTRECSRLAFAEKGRSLQASDLTEKVGEAFLNVIGEPGSRQ